MKTEEIVIIKIDGEEFETIFDEHDTQRFRQSSAIRHLVDTKQVDLNRLAQDFDKGAFTKEDYMAFYMGMGYSITGFDEIFGLSGINGHEPDVVQVKNPVWDEGFVRIGDLSVEQQVYYSSHPKLIDQEKYWISAIEGEETLLRTTKSANRHSDDYEELWVKAQDVRLTKA